MSVNSSAGTAAHKVSRDIAKRKERFLSSLKEGVSEVNRLATKGKNNYRLPTGKLLTDYRHGPTLSI